eukprot:227198-Rhodomonas_salina.3
MMHVLIRGYGTIRLETELGSSSSCSQASLLWNAGHVPLSAYAPPTECPVLTGSVSYYSLLLDGNTTNAVRLSNEMWALNLATYGWFKVIVADRSTPLPAYARATRSPVLNTRMTLPARSTAGLWHARTAVSSLQVLASVLTHQPTRRLVLNGCGYYQDGT